MLPKNIRRLEGIDPRAWEHPADRAALEALRSLRGLDELVRLLMSLTAERSLRVMHLASSVKVGPGQYARIDTMMSDLVETFGWPVRPTLFVSLSPLLNAETLGADEPLIILSSTLVRDFDDLALKAVLAHEFGHVMSGHLVFKTLAWFLANASLEVLPLPPALMAALRAALADWDRKSELTADRAALLGTQDETTNYLNLLRIAGGEPPEAGLEAFFEQAAEFSSLRGPVDGLHKFLNEVWLDHPLPVERLLELRTWASSGAYAAILGGVYQRRGGSAPEGQGGQSAWRDGGSPREKGPASGPDDPLGAMARGLGIDPGMGARLGGDLERAVSEASDKLREIFGTRKD